MLANGGNWWDQASIALPSTPVQKLHPTPCWFLSSKKFSASWNGLLGPCCQDGLGRKPACKSSRQKSCISRCVFFPLRIWWITTVFPRRSAFLPRLLPLPAFNTFQDPAINDVSSPKEMQISVLAASSHPEIHSPKLHWTPKIYHRSHAFCLHQKIVVHMSKPCKNLPCLFEGSKKEFLEKYARQVQLIWGCWRLICVYKMVG